MTIVLNGTTGITTPGTDSTTLVVNSNNFSNVNGNWRNRIINGAMVIDQRNAGASVTANDGYMLDRWKFNSTQNGKGTVQQVSVAPTGFTNSFLFTSTSTYSVLSSDLLEISQRVEGFNVSDLSWGTASAQTVTLSFWVRSSLTGTFGGAVNNSAFNRSYPFTYTISSANTWEQKSITIAGDTSGTWLTTNGIGIRVGFSLGAGSTYSGTAGSWAGAGYTSATGATSVVGTNGATFYITGVQLEAGSVASPFERRDYGRELAMCQRYYEKSFNESTAPAQNVSSSGAYSTMQVVGQGTTQYAGSVKFSVSKRVAPTVTLFGTQAANAEFYNVNTGTSCSASGTQSIGTNAFQTFTTTPAGAGGAGNGLFVQWTASSEL